MPTSTPLGPFRSLVRTTLHRIRPFQPFLSPDALAINQARQDHLASLGLDLEGRSVIEVGAGIGLHTAFFESRGCDVLSTDGRAENVEEIRRRHPDRQARQLDLDDAAAVRSAGHFDVMYCYGTLYHLSQPEAFLAAAADICDLVLLETCVTGGDELELRPISEVAANKTQASHGTGCRPTRTWVMAELSKDWGHAYISRTQPAHEQFPVDWSTVPTTPSTYDLTRAIFVGSHDPIDSDALVEQPLEVQERFHG
jgi:hypothetical protein